MKKYLFIIVAIFTVAFSSQAYAKDAVYTSLFSSEAVSGYDTVAYFTESKAVKGQDSFSTEWNGATWLFSSAENLEKFKNNPEKYAPQYGGYCAWAVANGSLASSDPKQWHIENGKLYLNYNKDIKEKWLPDRATLIPQADSKFSTLIN